MISVPKSQQQNTRAHKPLCVAYLQLQVYLQINAKALSLVYKASNMKKDGETSLNSQGTPYNKTIGKILNTRSFHLKFCTKDVACESWNSRITKHSWCTTQIFPFSPLLVSTRLSLKRCNFPHTFKREHRRLLIRCKTSFLVLL